MSNCITCPINTGYRTITQVQERNNPSNVAELKAGVASTNRPDWSILPPLILPPLIKKTLVICRLSDYFQLITLWCYKKNMAVLDPSLCTHVYTMYALNLVQAHTCCVSRC